ncbi:ribbon-helix-helix domain-containing protein [Nocardia carnea]|uniref:CopG family transcriptional regulator n=1 Tax=Nocardia carnea TaxID=37328 RepID=A0ABW7TUH2_9NOCA|nr:CopG family transcriptional regulator [Nocardia carnea]
MSRKKLTDEDYEDMARDYAEYPVAADEVVGEIEYRDPVVLDRGRPVGDAAKGGNTPVTSVRFPTEIRERLAARAEADGVKAAEVIRRAVVEYLNAS